MQSKNIETAIAELKQENVPSSIDFTVREDFKDALPQILSNLDEVEVWLRANTEVDRNLVLVTEEDFEQAKKRCSAINKVVKDINDKKIFVKKLYIKPYQVFEDRAKEVMAVGTTAKDNLWSQIVKAEEERKAEKEKKLREYWTAHGEILPYEQIANDKWLNKGVRLETAFAEMDERVKSIQADIQAIKGLHSEFEVALLESYSNGTTLNEIIAYNNRLQAQKQAVEREKTEERANTQPTPVKAVESEIKGVDDEPITDIAFRVWGTATQFAKLKAFLQENGMRYGKV